MRVVINCYSKTCLASSQRFSTTPTPPPPPNQTPGLQVVYVLKEPFWGDSGVPSEVSRL